MESKNLDRADPPLTVWQPRHGKYLITPVSPAVGNQGKVVAGGTGRGTRFGPTGMSG